MAGRLNDESIRGWLAGKNGWTRNGEAVVKEYKLPSFRDSIVFVNRIASIADEVNHHPDIDIRYNVVRIALSTHDAGGITGKDLEVAERIDFATSAR